MVQLSGKNKKLLAIAAVVMTFTGLATLVIFLGRAGIITIPMAILLLVALLGIYLGFGILIAAHMIVKKLD